MNIPTICHRLFRIVKPYSLLTFGQRLKLNGSVRGNVERHVSQDLVMPISFIHSSSRLYTDVDTVEKIKELIKDKIKPAIEDDGGDIEFVSYDDKVVYVRLQGACRSCPSSVITLKNGIKNVLQYHIPEIEDVEQVKDVFN